MPKGAPPGNESLGPAATNPSPDTFNTVAAAAPTSSGFSNICTPVQYDALDHFEILYH